MILNKVKKALRFLFSVLLAVFGGLSTLAIILLAVIIRLLYVVVPVGLLCLVGYWLMQATGLVG